MTEAELENILQTAKPDADSLSTKKQRAACYRFLLAGVRDRAERERRTRWVKEQAGTKARASDFIGGMIVEAARNRLDIPRRQESPPLMTT